MLSRLLRGSDRTVVASPSNWGAIISDINTALADIKEKFRLAFAEGKATELSNREFIKRDVFLEVWRWLSKKPVTEFANLNELDAHFAGLHKTLNVRIEDYCNTPKIRELAEYAGLTETLSENKVNMLLELAGIYHVLMRCQFQLLYLQTHYSQSPFSPDDCLEGVKVFRQQCALVPELIRDIDVDSYRTNYVEAIVQMNHHLIKLFYQNGYGQVESDELLQPDETIKSADHGLLGFYHELRQLIIPAGELTALVEQKPSADRTRQLQEAVIKLELARNLLTAFKQKMVSHHLKKMDSLDNECQRLRRSINQLRDSDKFAEFFTDIGVFAVMLTKNDTKAGVLGLELAAEQVIACASQQSWGAKLGRNNGWPDAISCVTAWNSNIDKTTGRVFKSYTNARRIYNQAISILAKLNNNWLGDVNGIMQDWNHAISDADYVFKEIDGLIDKAQAILGRCAESNLEYWKNFAKRHWWKGALLAVVPVGGGAAVGVVVLKSMLAAVGLPAMGLLLGGASGAGWGFAQDSKKPPHPDLPNVPPQEQDAHDTNKILNVLYESEGVVIKKEKEEEMPSRYEEDDEHRNLIDLSISDDEGEESAPSTEAFERIRLFGGTSPAEMFKETNSIPVFRLE
jgi:hypothetical protein